MIRILTVAAVGAFLCACTTNGARGPVTFASTPFTSANTAERVEGPLRLDLAELLGSPGGTRLEPALQQFRQDYRTERQRIEARNAVVGALLLASNRNCSVYVENVRAAQVTYRSIFDVAGLGLNSASIIVGAEGTKNTLSGLAGLSDSISTSLDDNLLSGLAHEVVVEGIETRRQESRLAILQKLDVSYQNWPVEVAIADALAYHGECSVIAGLAEAKDALSGKGEKIDQIEAAVTQALQ